MSSARGDAGAAGKGDQSAPWVRFLGLGLSNAWREEAWARADEIRTLSEWIGDLPLEKRGEPKQAADDRIAGAIEKHVSTVQAAAEAHGPFMWTGARLGRIASNLHAAEADLLRRAPMTYLCGELPNLDAHVRRHLPVDDPRRLRVEDLARKARDDLTRNAPFGKVTLHPMDRETIIAAFRAASSAAEREQQRIRSFRNIVLAATVLLFLIAGGVAWFSAAHPTFVALCFTPQPEQGKTAQLVCPTGQNPLPGGTTTPPGGTTTPPGGTTTPPDVDNVVAQTVTPWDVPLIEIIGMVAAGVTGAVALRRLRGTSTPFDVPVALNLLKLPTGALTAFLGLVLMRGGFVPGLTALDTTPQIIAWAVIFGASQQLVTGLVDRQAQTVLEGVGGKTYTPTGGG